MKPLDELLLGIGALLQVKGEWLARAKGDAVYASGTTPREAVEKALDLATVEPAGSLCSVCGEPQIDTPSGVSCPSGHGGAEPLDNSDLF